MLSEALNFACSWTSFWVEHYIWNHRLHKCKDALTTTDYLCLTFVLRLTFDYDILEDHNYHMLLLVEEFIRKSFKYMQR